MRCRIHTLSRKIFTVGKVARISRRLEFAFGPHVVAIAKIGEWRCLDEHQSLHRPRRLVGDDKRVRLDAQVGVRVARVRLCDDDAFDDDRLGLIIIRGKCALIKVWLRGIVAERAQNRGQRAP